LPPQSVHWQASFAEAVKAKATTAMIAKSIFFIVEFSVEVSFLFSFRLRGRKPTPGEPSGSRRGNVGRG
jgi:hypothetical protein